jgi:hypothetical protein
MARTLILALIAMSAFAEGPLAQEQSKKQTGNSHDPAKKSSDKAYPDLVAALKSTKGCLGVETARTSSGKNVIFAWFEDKHAVLRWYHSEVHKELRDGFSAAPYFHDKPLEGVPNDVGPVMAIASITFAKESRFKDISLPISQISIELYKPITGGIFLGGRFAPDGLKVPGMKDYTSKLSKN